MYNVTKTCKVLYLYLYKSSYRKGNNGEGLREK